MRCLLVITWDINPKLESAVNDGENANLISVVCGKKRQGPE